LVGRLVKQRPGGWKVSDVIHVTRTQLPIVPAFAITTYKAQGLTMYKIVVDLQSPSVTSQVASIYVLNLIEKYSEHVLISLFEIV
jgi:ATP-dependent exoDNAse (exonuclease V) alpha subunit